MLETSVAQFLGSYWRNTPLYSEKLIPLLDYCLSNNYVFTDKMSSAFYELINKYQHTTELPADNLREFISEYGYGYIADLFENDADKLKLVVYFLALIHELKGTEAGLKLIIGLFQSPTEPSDTQIINWYETLPMGEENTFTINTTIDVSKAGDKFFTNFNNFIRNYVYPELKALDVRYSMTAQRQQIPVTTIVMNYTAYGELP